MVVSALEGWRVEEGDMGRSGAGRGQTIAQPGIQNNTRVGKTERAQVREGQHGIGVRKVRVFAMSTADS